MAAFEEAREGEIVFDLAVLSLVATVQDFLAALPRLSTHQRLMNTLVDSAGVLELARVDAVPKNFMQRRHRDFALAKPKSLFVALLGSR
jgi:hypothetical protein